MNKTIILSTILSLTLATLLLPPLVTWGETGSSPTITINPQTVTIGPFYNGKYISIIAKFPKGDDVALICKGPEEILKLMRKGRVLGFWMNVEEVVFHRVPTLYFVVTSKSVEAGKDKFKEIPVGYEDLYSRVEIEKHEAEKANLFRELVKLKESDHLYFVSLGTLKLTHREHDIDQVVTTFFIPPKALPGEYKISLFRLSNRGAVLLGNQTLTVKKVGFIAYLSSLAIHHGLLYGLIAVIIAVLTGLAVGIIFTSRGGH